MNGSFQYVTKDKTLATMTTQKRVTSPNLQVHGLLPAGDT